MADIFTPQTFSFGTLTNLKGQLSGWSGSTPRTMAMHRYPKRAGGRAEDMNRGPRSLDVRLEFISYRGANNEVVHASDQYLEFLAAVDKDPIALLTHPIAGQYIAFCEGPHDDVDFNRATNEIRVRVVFHESNLDKVLVDFAPDAATAAQIVVEQQSIFERAVADYMGAIAEVHAKTDPAVAAIQAQIAIASVITDPINQMRQVITTVGGIESSIIGLIVGIADSALLLSQDITNFVEANSTTDLFNGFDSIAAAAENTSTLLGTVVKSAEDLEQLLIESSQTPAGAAEVVGENDEAVSTCIVLAEALQSDRPPLIKFTVPRLTDVIALAVDRYPNDSASSRASEILGLNRIPNPAAIPAGTVLKIYSR